MTSSKRTVMLVWLFVSALTLFPYVVAYSLPPTGRAFQGFFFFTDDQHLYLSSSQQAEDGAFLFRNKLVTEPHAPGLVNLEWWLVGVVSRGLGRRPFLAYRLIAVLASLGFFFTVAHWLRRGGLPDERLAPALCLIATGGGFGGLLYAAGLLPIDSCLDLKTGLFPFVGLIGNPHFTIATTLFLAGLLAFCDGSLRGQLQGVAFGSVLALTRPYDSVLLVGLRGAFVALRHPLREWPRRLVSLVGFLPVVALNYWFFYRNPAFAFYAQTPYEFPATRDFALALLPAAVAAVSLLRVPATDAAASEVRLHLLLWIAFGLLVIVFHPVHYSLQFLMGIGVPLLACAALGLGPLAPRGLWIAALALGTTPIVTLQLLLQPMPAWYPQRERLEIAYALRPFCRTGDVVLAPKDIGLLVDSLTRCQAYVAHELQQSFPIRDAELRGFYAPAEPMQRAELLDRHCIRILILPGDDGDRPTHWLPEGTPFRKAASVGAEVRVISAYSRPSGCEP